MGRFRARSPASSFFFVVWIFFGFVHHDTIKALCSYRENGKGHTNSRKPWLGISFFFRKSLLLPPTPIQITTKTNIWEFPRCNTRVSHCRWRNPWRTSHYPVKKKPSKTKLNLVKPRQSELESRNRNEILRRTWQNLVRTQNPIESNKNLCNNVNGN